MVRTQVAHFCEHAKNGHFYSLAILAQDSAASVAKLEASSFSTELPAVLRDAEGLLELVEGMEADWR